jgi:hypothetical protein
MQLSEIEQAYIIDLLAKITESADCFIEDPTWLDLLTEDIAKNRELLKKYYKRLKQQDKKEKLASDNDNWIKQTNKDIREGKV